MQYQSYLLFSVPHVFNDKGFKLNKRDRPSQIKFVKYERQKPNELWHTDWAECPFTRQHIIAFIDDCSRVLIHAEYFAHATTESSVIAFSNAISKYGRPEGVLTDNGTQFTPARGNKGTFTLFCNSQNIKHILGRVHHPQTNGKIEKTHIIRSLFGYIDKSNHGNYTYDKSGLLSKFKHEKIDKSVMVVNRKDEMQIKNILRKFRLNLMIIRLPDKRH